ncbi:hypothetical protein DRH29_01840 [candidate division Kazan bacterium]|uniref:LysM domain-containing protein n=1 Tax=candidate division Kazan bacterium TaxID=2202143 RepID=A0A420ZD18_UNCK3|nr:MAG: hypothetical protein DRH29_01840 [candidate division Kazan bacterium]
MMRSLHGFGSHWAITILAISVILSGLTPRSAAVAIGGEEGRLQNRYRTIAELASVEYFHEDVVYDEVITTVGENNDYIFKTGATQTVISRNSRRETIIYTVKEGESVASVASDFGLSVDTIKYANKLSGNSLKVGQELKIPAVDGVFIAVRKNDTLSTIASRYHVSVDDIVKYNKINREDPIFSGQEILVPGVVAPKTSGGRYVPSGDVANLPAFNPLSGSGQFVWPTSTHTHFISQGYYYRHKAIDLNRLNGWGIYASAAGIVRTYTGRYGYGNYIDINHGDGWVTRYAHLSSFNVKSGDYVQQGQLIARMGSTGRSTGPHLHFEIRYNGKPLNPLSYLPR